MIEQTGPEPESVGASVDDDVATIEHKGGALFDTEIDIRAHTIAMRGRDKRTHISSAVASVGDDKRLRPFDDGIDEFIAHRIDRHNNADGHAALARRAIPGAHRSIGGEFEIGIGQHDHVVLRPAQCLHALAAFGG